MATLTNRKLPSAIPIFAVRFCINPSTASGKSFGFKTHDFEMKTKHGQLDLPTGIFTVITPGIYQFHFNSTINILRQQSRHFFQLRVDGVAKATSYSQTASETGGFQPVVISALLPLNAAQKVGVFLVDGALSESGPNLVTQFSATLFVN